MANDVEALRIKITAIAQNKTALDEFIKQKKEEVAVLQTVFRLPSRV